MRLLCAIAVFSALTACGNQPYTDYFPDAELAPEITSITPPEIDGIDGGQGVVISGTGLANARTVVIGSRNATILEATDTSVSVLIPSFTAGGGAVEVAVVTDDGIARLDRSFTYKAPAGDFTADEAASAYLAVVDCPVEAWGYSPSDDDYVPLWWCGMEMGWVEGGGWDGTGLQPGYAGDMSGYGQLSSLPPVGEGRFYGSGDPRPSKPGQFFKYLPAGGYISVTTERDFARDLAYIAEKTADLETYYSYWDDISFIYEPFAVGRIDDEDVCWTELEVESALGDTLFFDGDPSDWSHIDLAYGVEELDGEYYTEGYFSTATVDDASNGSLVGGSSGIVLEYDDYSGQFGPNAERWPGGGDVPFDERYFVRTKGLEEGGTPRGAVQSVTELELITPDLMTGLETLDMSGPIEFTWVPEEGDEDPSFLVVDIRVYDTQVTNPDTGWFAEIARFVTQGDDAAGSLTIPVEQLAQMPTAAPTFDDNYDFVELYAEVTVARHQLRKVATEDDESLVVDFVHAIAAPVDLVR